MNTESRFPPMNPATLVTLPPSDALEEEIFGLIEESMMDAGRKEARRVALITQLAHPEWFTAQIKWLKSVPWYAQTIPEGWVDHWAIAEWWVIQWIMEGND